MRVFRTCRPAVFSPSSRRPLTAICLGVLLLALAACAPSTISEPGQSGQGAPQVIAPPEWALNPLPPGFPPSPLMPQNASVRVALLVPLSGPQAPIGQALLQSAQIALFDTAGESFAMIVRDTGGTPEGAVRAANEAIAAGAQLVLGPLFSSSVTAVAPVARAAHVNVVAFSTDRSVAGNGVFLIGLLPGPQIERVVAYAGRQGLHRFAALAPNSAYGQATVSALRLATTRSGTEMAHIEYYNPAATDVSDSVRRLASFDGRAAALEAERAALAEKNDEASRQALARLQQYQTFGEVGFDAVLLPEGGSQLRAIAPLLPYYDIDPKQVRLLGTALWDDPDLGREPALVGGWFAAPQPEPWNAFRKRYESLYKSTPPRVVSLAYDAAALAAVLGRGGVPNFTAEALTQPNGFSGVDGVFRFLPDGTAERGLAVLEVRSDGLAVIEPAPKTFQEVLY